MIDLSGGDIQIFDHKMDMEADISAARYARQAGEPKLIEALTALKKPADGRQLVITAGASVGLAAALSLVCASGHGVLMPQYAYPGFSGLARVLGIPTGRYQLSTTTFSAASMPGATCLIFNAPQNPTGMVPGSEATEQLVSFCSTNGLTIILDEVYQKLWADEPPVLAIARAKGVAVIQIGSLSKQLALAGARIGYVIADQELAGAIVRNHFALAMSASSIGQVLALNVLRDPNLLAWSDGIEAELKRRRNLAREVFGAVGIDGDRTPFFWTDLTALSGPQGRFVNLAERAGVLVAPGAAFAGRADGHIRINLAACDESMFSEGLDRLARLRSVLEKRKTA